MWEFVLAGGVMMIPLILSSIVLLAIIIERYYFFKTILIMPDNLFEDVHLIYQNNPTMEKINLLAKHSLLGSFYAYCLERHLKGDRDISLILGEALQMIILKMERYITVLGVLASITPLMGLLGTIFGIIRLFSVMMNSNPETHLLANGIAEALVTTAAGLIIAIPSIIAYRFFVRKIDNYTVVFEKYGNRLAQVMNANAN